MSIRKGSLVRLNPNRVPTFLQPIAAQGQKYKVDSVTGPKGKYRVNIGTDTFPLDFFIAIPQKKGKNAPEKVLATA